VKQDTAGQINTNEERENWNRTKPNTQ